MALLSPWVFAFGRISVFYTHPRELSVNERMLIRFLRLADRVAVMNSSSRDDLLARGVPAENIEVVLCAASPQFFSCRSWVRADGRIRVGVSSAFYERKNPDLLLDVVSGMPGCDFVLVGRNWENYSRFNELRALPNLKILSLKYPEYPEFYRSLDVLLSISSLEGGPVPLIEAMMSGVPVVATETGFAPDIVREGVNGKLVPLTPSVDQVRFAIERVRLLEPAAVRESIEHLDWFRFTQRALGGLV
jgi:glycosyltransferase involved in cell wall biosynthesis